MDHPNKYIGSELFWDILGKLDTVQYPHTNRDTTLVGNNNYSKYSK